MAKDPKKVREPKQQEPKKIAAPVEVEEDGDGQSTRPAGWPGIPGPNEEHLGTLATHGETKEEPARVTQAQRELEQEMQGGQLELDEDDEAEEREAERKKEEDDVTQPLA